MIITLKGMKMKKLLLSLLVLLFVACAQPVVQKEEMTLQNTKWKLVSFGMKRMAVPQNAWISFKDGRYSGNAGCNGMGGQYILKDKDLELKAGMSTLMACANMALETKFRQEMDKVTSYKFERQQLVLLQDNHAVLNFIEVTSE